MKIFLGYASENLDCSREIYSFLKEMNEDVWFDKESLVGGDDWDRERLKAQRDADLVIHLVSDHVFSRPGVVNREIKQTLELTKDQPIGSNYAIFVRLDDIRMPAELLSFQYIDYFTGDWREGLAQAIGKRLSQLEGRMRTPAVRNTTTTAVDSADPRNVSAPLHIESSESTEKFSVRAEYLRYRGDGIYWDFLNSRLTSEALGGYLSAVAGFRNLNEDDKDRIERFGTPYDWGMKMQEFYRMGELISIRSLIYYYMGGVHPNYHISTLNFFGSNHGLCSIKDLLGNDDDKILRIGKYCKKVLLAYLEDNDMESRLAETFDDVSNAWSVLAQYNFDHRGLTFNFSPYDPLPYAFGTHEVFVPWGFINELICDRYRDTENILNNIVESS